MRLKERGSLFRTSRKCKLQTKRTTVKHRLLRQLAFAWPLMAFLEVISFHQIILIPPRPGLDNSFEGKIYVEHFQRASQTNLYPKLGSPITWTMGELDCLQKPHFLWKASTC